MQSMRNLKKNTKFFAFDIKPFQRVDRYYTSESDVCGRQNLTYKDGPRTERIKIFIVVVDITYPDNIARL